MLRGRVVSLGPSILGGMAQQAGEGWSPARVLAGRPGRVGSDFNLGGAPRRQPGGEAPVFAGRHGPLELAAEAVHVDLIPQLAAHHAAFATTTDLFEAGLLVSLDPVG